MRHLTPILLGLAAGCLLCHCSGAESKKKDPSEMSLAQRAMRKPDESQRSQFEKHITSTKDGRGGTAAWYQHQKHHSKSFSGSTSQAAQKQFKTSQSSFGKSKASGMDMTYALGDRQSSMGGDSFKTGSSSQGRKQAREGAAAFSGAGDIYKTGSALPRSQQKSKAPLIIENFEATSMKKSAYSEDEVKRLINRN